MAPRGGRHEERRGGTTVYEGTQQGPDPGAGGRQGGDERAHRPRVRARRPAAQPAEAAPPLPHAAEPLCRRLAVDRRAARARPRAAGHTLFALLCERRPGRYRPVQLRTLQRQIAAWRLAARPRRRRSSSPRSTAPASPPSPTSPTWPRWASPWAACPSRTCSSTWCFVYSNVEAVQLCFCGELRGAGRRDRGAACGSSAGVPRQHRTDHLERRDPPARCRRPGPGEGALRAR